MALSFVPLAESLSLELADGLVAGGAVDAPAVDAPAE
jgi:hypothetical protein